ncbi:MAG: type II secretion system F family protein [Chromatiales bacterium]|jgi:type IV pilus assembly protein PilC|nr:type II secretion system F family protein [Chromatiales bacterium]
MPLMKYKAIDERGKSNSGSMEAVNVADLEMRLGRMGLDLVNYHEARTFGQRAGGRPVQRRELISFCLHLEQLVSSGVPLIDGLTDLRDSVDDQRLRETIAGMIEGIEGGKTLSDAMALYPRVFDDVFVSLIRAGELSGQIGEVLRKITETLKWQDEQSAHVKKLLAYPIIVGCVVSGVVFFLMYYLVPQLVSFIKSVGQELPGHTLVLIAVSNFVVEYWYVVILGPIGTFFLVAALKQVNPAVDYALDDFKLRVWFVGPILKKIILARFATYFAMLYASGITVLECIRISETLVGNKAIREATRKAERQIQEGASISAGFESAGLFPPLVLRMLRVGENTGALDTALLNISYFYERDVRESIDRLQTMIGPAMTFVLGGVLIWVMISVLGPIYDVITQLKT